MEPENLRVGGGSAVSSVNPAVLLAVILVIALIYILPRVYAVVPLLAGVVLIPLGQTIVIGGVHFTMMRVIILGALTMACIRKDPPGEDIGAIRLETIDKIVGAWALAFSFCFICLWGSEAIVNRVGFMIDSLGAYVALRSRLRCLDDMRMVVRTFAACSCIVAVGMVVEQGTAQNIFGRLGGVVATPEIRNGRVRSQGPFQHALLAGAFGATLAPLCIWLWKDAKYRTTAVFGLIGATIMTMTTAASTPVMGYLAGICAFGLWPVRRYMRVLRISIVVVLFALHLMMKAPVWALIARLDLTGSSSSYHRYMLVDNFIRNIGSWYLYGSTDNGTWGWDMWDLSNQYVAYGLSGGIATLGLFLLLLTRCFGELGTARKLAHDDIKRQWMIWSLGCALFAHTVVCFGVNYWDQIAVAWYALIAMIVVGTKSAPLGENVGRHGPEWAGDMFFGSGECVRGVAPKEEYLLSEARETNG